MKSNRIKARVVEGHGIASGKTKDARFPNGTLAMQAPFFLKEGLNLSHFFQGTINLDLSPSTFKLGAPRHQFKSIAWTEHLQAENFSFYSCELSKSTNGPVFDCLVYWPHPSTKPAFHQKDSVLEIVGPHVPELSCGSEIYIAAPRSSITFSSP